MASVNRPGVQELSDVAWHVSTRSGNGDGNCVEAGPVLDGSRRVAVRDSKDRTGPVLVYSATAWTTFIAGLRVNGSLPRQRITKHGGGTKTAVEAPPPGGP